MNTWNKNWQDQSIRENWLTPAPDVETLIPLFKSEGVTKILDLACGIGRHAFLFAQNGFSVTGTDSAQSAIDYCKNWFTQEGLKGDFQVRNMSDIPFEANSLDAVIAYNAVYHAYTHQIVKTIDQIYKSLKIGGFFYGTFIDTQNHRYGLGKEVEPNTFIMDEGPEIGVPHHYVDESELRDLFSNFFEILSIRRLDQDTRLYDSKTLSSKLSILGKKKC